MKKITTLLMLVFAFNLLNAQLNKDFKPKEAITFATDEAKKIYPNVKLRAIATLVTKVNSFDLKFNSSTGEATIWAYVFEDTSRPDSTTVVPLLKSILNTYTNLSSLISVAQFKSFIPKTSISSTDFIDSDEMLTIMKGGAKYQEFMASNPSATISYIAMGNNDNFTQLKLNEPYWTVNYIANNDNFICATHAITKETNCFSIATSVESNENSNISLSPNPASDKVVINLNGFNSDDIIDSKIIDSKGQVVVDITDNFKSGSKVVFI